MWESLVRTLDLDFQLGTDFDDCFRGVFLGQSRNIDSTHRKCVSQKKPPSDPLPQGARLRTAQLHFEVHANLVLAFIHQLLDYPMTDPAVTGATFVLMEVLFLKGENSTANVGGHL